jgi:hypothetical protein
MIEEKNPEEKMELSHEPIPIYRKIFHLAIVLGVVYLGVLFWISLF